MGGGGYYYIHQISLILSAALSYTAAPSGTSGFINTSSNLLFSTSYVNSSSNATGFNTSSLGNSSLVTVLTPTAYSFEVASTYLYSNCSVRACTNGDRTSVLPSSMNDAMVNLWGINPWNSSANSSGNITGMYYYDVPPAPVSSFPARYAPSPCLPAFTLSGNNAPTAVYIAGRNFGSGLATSNAINFLSYTTSSNSSVTSNVTRLITNATTNVTANVTTRVTTPVYVTTVLNVSSCKPAVHATLLVPDDGRLLCTLQQALPKG